MKRALLLATPLAAGGLVVAAARRGNAPALAPAGDIRVVDGERIHVIDRGAGPAIVLVHGFLGHTASWRFVIDDLALDHRVIAFDLPGFGFSQRDPASDLGHGAHARRLRALLDALGIDRATVVGHSMGGAVAQRFAVQFPERLQGLVLVCAVDASIQPDWGRRSRGAGALMTAMRGLTKWPSLLNRLTLRTLRRIVADPARLTPADAWLYTVPLLQPRTIDCIQAMFGAVREEQPVDLSGISAPTLVLSGEFDTAVPPAVGAKLAAAIPGARALVWPSVGHLPAEEDPAAFLQQLRAFVAQPALTQG